ncbi:MAG: hypothetical protein QGF90_14635, partial [Gammaproteobacteria bacterium]|nr:hypothetical protein [Gammaproteobacteria bacterium]
MCASTIGTGGTTGIALIDNTWLSLIEFQYQVNTEIAIRMKALETGGSFTALLFALGGAFLYGMAHALGPGHGKFVIISYFMGREVHMLRGLIMALQMAVVHVIAAVVIVWIADVVLKASLGIRLAEVPGVRAGSFLIIAVIGLYMLYQAVRISFGHTDTHQNYANQNHAHEHSHHHGHNHTTEGGLVAMAVGMVPCPGAVLVMLFAVANDMIYPGFMLVAAMSAGIGLTIAVLGVGTILTRQLVTRIIKDSRGGLAVARFRTVTNYTGALLVTAIGTASF